MRERVIPKSISDSVQYPVRQFITAGRANEPVPDQSVFKQAFLDLLEGRDSEPIPDHYITGEELGLYLKTKVPQYNPGQHPQYGKIKDPRLDKGDFVFVLKRPESIRQPDPQPSDLAAEKKRLADETAQIERERQELAQLKLELGKQKLEAESQRLEEEKLKLASIPKTVAVTRILLREKPIVITNQIHITNMLFKYDFFERYKNPRGSFENVFIDNNDGTITDRATGLMWQKSGSSKFLDNINIKEYIKRLNIQKLSGYSDWRMPTIEELASLLTRRRKNGVHIDPVFDNKQVRCWSVDQSDPIEPYYSVAWIISFEFGEVTQAIYIKKSKIQWGTGAQNKNAMNYIKAVRAVK
jgi:hypothetical protein